jgi:hypothetical protein
MRALLLRPVSDAPVPEVLEQFVFDFEFAADGSGSVGVTSKGSKAGGKGRTALAAGEAVTVGSMKKQACALLRNLIASISTLGTVPEDRVLSIQARCSLRQSSCCAAC